MQVSKVYKINIGEKKKYFTFWHQKQNCAISKYYMFISLMQSHIKTIAYAKRKKSTVILFFKTNFNLQFLV